MISFDEAGVDVTDSEDFSAWEFMVQSREFISSSYKFQIHCI